MSNFNALVARFKEDMAKVAAFVNGDANTEITTSTGVLPSLAKQAKAHSDSLIRFVSSMQNYLRIDAEVTYNDLTKKQLRQNVGLDLVNNTADADKPLSDMAKSAFDGVAERLKEKETLDHRNKINGYFGYDGARLPIRNGADKLFGYIYHNSTAIRNWKMPDKDGTVALMDDIERLTASVAKLQEQLNTLKAG